MHKGEGVIERPMIYKFIKISAEIHRCLLPSERGVLCHVQVKEGNRPLGHSKGLLFI